MSAPIIVVGRLVADPELRFSPTGVAVVKLRIVTSARVKEGEEWVDKDTTFWDVTGFRQLAENTAEGLKKGDPVVVLGKIKQREWEDKEGNKRTAFDVTADEIGASLKFHSINVKRTERGKVDAFTKDPWAA